MKFCIWMPLCEYFILICNDEDLNDADCTTKSTKVCCIYEFDGSKWTFCLWLNYSFIGCFHISLHFWFLNLLACVELLRETEPKKHISIYAQRYINKGKYIYAQRYFCVYFGWKVLLRYLKTSYTNACTFKVFL